MSKRTIEAGTGMKRQSAKPEAVSFGCPHLGWTTNPLDRNRHPDVTAAVTTYFPDPVSTDRHVVMPGGAAYSASKLAAPVRLKIP